MMQRIPPITKNLLIINLLCFLAQKVMRLYGIDLTDALGLHFALAESFGPWQLVSYMFLHGSFTHLFFNMFSLWMFGGLIERTLGARRFLTYFFVCGIGAGICQELWQTAQYFIDEMYKYEMVNTGSTIIPMSYFLNQWTTIGASGACYGVLLAFGMLYPNERIMLLLPPIPMKAKYFVAGYAVIELVSAYASNDNVAHLAHLGGMLFGWLLLRLWRKRTQRTQWGNGGWTQWTDASSHKGPTLMQRIRAWFNLPSSGSEGGSVGNAHHAPQRPETDHEYNERRKREEERMDEILDKVRRSGYSGLTREEKEELFKLSRK